MSEHEENVQRRERAFSQHEQALDRVDAARAARNDAQLEAELAEFQVAAMRLQELEETARLSAARVERLRGAYLSALNAREEEILAELNTGLPIAGGDEQALITEWQDIRYRAVTLEAESGSDEPPTLRPVPELTVDPRDDRDDVLAKQNLMEERAASYDSIIVDLQDRVAELEREMRRNQSLQDLLRDVQRSGPNFVPGAPLLPPRADDGDADGGAGDGDDTDGFDLALSSRPIEERIELLRGTIALAAEYRDDARARAETFQARAEAMGR